MKKVLLVTSLPNLVCEMLKAMDGVDLCIMDCSERTLNKSVFCVNLLKLVKRVSFAMMVTYRCPYVVPSEIRAHVDMCINIHPLSLPEFAGLNPWEKFRESGMTGSEVVAHIMEDEPDTGRVISRKSYTFDDIESAREVADVAASELIKEIIINQFKI